jgi:hypothetical protein
LRKRPSGQRSCAFGRGQIRSRGRALRRFRSGW